MSWPFLILKSNIKVQTNLTTNALSYHQPKPTSELEKNDKDDKCDTIAYSTVHQILGEETLGLKLDRELKCKIQEEEENNCTVEITSTEVKVLNKITHEKIRRAKMNNEDLVEVIKYIEVHDKPPSYAKIRRLDHQ